MSTPSPRAALALVGVVAALLAATAAPAHAQPRVAPRDEASGAEQEAREHFQTGVQLYEELNYDGALAEFEESFRLRAVPIVMFNIAQSQRQLRRYAEAIESFTQYLDIAGPALAPDRRAAVNATIEQLRRSIGTVDVESDPSGAELRVDGRSVGATPRRGLQLAAGLHVFELTAEGAVPVREEITIVARRERLLRFGLPARFRAAELTVLAPHPGAVVAIDGIEVGAAPVTRQLGAGGHRVEVRAPGFDSQTSEVVLLERQHRTLRVSLTRPGGVATRWYFWTTLGVLTTAAVVTGVLIATQPAAPDPVVGSGDPSVISLSRPMP